MKIYKKTPLGAHSGKARRGVRGLIAPNIVFCDPKIKLFLQKNKNIKCKQQNITSIIMIFLILLQDI